jgi:PadR family transcriptional regulator, regulatory protein PadR
MELESPVYWKSLINMSLSKFFILQTLYQGPTHGYALLEKMRLFTQGCCTPTYATIYPILSELAKGEYALVKQESTGDRPRKVYELTDKGKLAYQEALKVWREVLPYLNKVVNE